MDKSAKASGSQSRMTLWRREVQSKLKFHKRRAEGTSPSTKEEDEIVQCPRMTGDAAAPQSLLLQLPVELRLKIYEFAAELSAAELYFFQTSIACTWIMGIYKLPTIGQLYSVCRQIRADLTKHTLNAPIKIFIHTGSSTVPLPAGKAWTLGEVRFVCSGPLSDIRRRIAAQQGLVADRRRFLVGYMQLLVAEPDPQCLMFWKQMDHVKSGARGIGVDLFATRQRVY